MTSASGGVLPVTSIDGHAIGNGKPGPITQKAHALYPKAERKFHSPLTCFRLRNSDKGLYRRFARRVRVGRMPPVHKKWGSPMNRKTTKSARHISQCCS